MQTQPQAQTDQVRDQLRASQLREQQRQRTSDTTRKAFQNPNAQQGIDAADRARRDRYRAQQRQDVQAYEHRQQVEASGNTGSGQPATSSSAH